jgi:hypothetical protein
VLGVTQSKATKVVALSSCRVAEFQRRGVVHLHAVVRLDCADGARLSLGPDQLARACLDGARSVMVRMSNWRHKVWNPAALELELPQWATPYVLRRTAASLMAQQGVPVSAAAAALGHDPAIFLRTYAHLYPGDLRAVADAMDVARQSAHRSSASCSTSLMPRGDSAGMSDPSGSTLET